MKARFRWVLEKRSHPYDTKQAEQGITCWCLHRVIEPEKNDSAFWSRVELVAVFDCNSEAELLMRAIYDGHRIEVPPDMVDLFETQDQNRGR